MDMESLNKILNSLAKRESSEVVFNQYKNENILNNLRLYLEYLLRNKPEVMLVGEAPGYRGCGLTGIPFSSGKLVMDSGHDIFKEIKDRIKLEKIVSENTAKILWDFIENKSAPILWNAFPFHPHKKENIKSNRKPTSLEIKEGREYLLDVFELFNPERLCAIGRVGEAALKIIFPDREIIYIRHPSYGGKKYFIEGMKLLLA